MPRRNVQDILIKPKGLSDAVDGTNAFPGAMTTLQNLVANPSTDNQWVPRPASISVTNFSGFNTPEDITALNVIGTIAWGMISSSNNPGNDEPFCYDMIAGDFIPISNVTAANTPTSPAMTGDWTPPCLVAVTNSRLILTHPGFDGFTNFIGWIDISSFSSSDVTGNTNTSNRITNLSSNVLQDGWQVGYLIEDSAADIPANTYITEIDANGLGVTISQAATASTAATTFTVTGGTPAAPVWGAGQVNGFPLTSLPSCVAQFNGEAWYGVKNGVQFSDSLNPLQITNANQALTLGDSVPVNAMATMPFTNVVTGGAVQALIIFKGDSIFYQITGDYSSTITQTAVPVSVGTLAPNTICNTPQGLAFVAPDGVRLLSPQGSLSSPLGVNGQGVVVPFINVVNPTRMCAAFNQNVLRVSVQNGNAEGQPVQEYWLDFDDMAWSGPHTFPAGLISPVQGNDNGFLMAASGIAAQLWFSVAKPTDTSTYIENGVQIACAFQPTLFPDSNSVSENCIVDSRIGLALPSTTAITILALDEQGNTLNLVSLAGTGAQGSVWDAFNWGSGVWGGAIPSSYQQYGLPWTAPLVFKQMTILLTTLGASGLIIGNLYAKNQRLSYPGYPI